MDGFAQLQSSGQSLIGEFHDQDAVLGSEAHQNQKTHLAVDIQRQTTQLQADQGTHQRDRHRQQDDQWIDETLVETGQQQIDHHHPEAEQDPGHIRSLTFLLGQSGEGQADVVAPHRVAGLLQQLNGLTRAHTTVGDSCDGD